MRRLIFPPYSLFFTFSLFLLSYDTSLTVEAALRHPWIVYEGQPAPSSNSKKLFGGHRLARTCLCLCVRVCVCIDFVIRPKFRMPLLPYPLAPPPQASFGSTPRFRS